jgi:Mrp family chromosome partitioning ATPase
MKDLLFSLREEFDHIIIDTPPALTVTDGVLLATMSDATLLVARAATTSKVALRRVRDMLAQVDARLLGVVLNAADFNQPDRYYYSYRYGRYGRYGYGGYYGSSHEEEESAKAARED